MHVYIYDDYVSNKKYDSLIAKIETRITDLSLNGKIIRLNVMRNIEDAIDNEIKRGAKTIVAVGNNTTVHKIINAIIKARNKTSLGDNIPLGIIPIGKKNNEIAEAVGIEKEENACDNLLARRLEKISLAKANEHYFLTNGIIESSGTILEMSENYKIEILENGLISIINLPITKEESQYSSPKDEKLELIIRTKPRKFFFKKTPKKTNKSFFSLNKLTIINKNKPLILDYSKKINTPAIIRLSKNKLNLIVGKNRTF
jgi:hypothetical protein